MRNPLCFRHDVPMGGGKFADDSPRCFNPNGGAFLMFLARTCSNGWCATYWLTAVEGKCDGTKVRMLCFFLYTVHPYRVLRFGCFTVIMTKGRNQHPLYHSCYLAQYGLLFTSAWDCTCIKQFQYNGFLTGKYLVPA